MQGTGPLNLLFSCMGCVLGSEDANSLVLMCSMSVWRQFISHGWHEGDACFFLRVVLLMTVSRDVSGPRLLCVVSALADGTP